MEQKRLSVALLASLSLSLGTLLLADKGFFGSTVAQSFANSRSLVTTFDLAGFYSSTYVPNISRSPFSSQLFDVASPSRDAALAELGVVAQGVQIDGSYVLCGTGVFLDPCFFRPLGSNDYVQAELDFAFERISPYVIYALYTKTPPSSPPDFYEDWSSQLVFGSDSVEVDPLGCYAFVTVCGKDPR